jgi:hypothetical protein
MNANALRTILLVKNVEEQDADGALLPLAERDAATRAALRRWPAADARPAVPTESRDSRTWQVLATRADELYGRLVARHPVVTSAVALEAHVARVGVVVLLGAFIVGLVLSLLDSRVRVEILAFPLLGVVLWNLCVYMLLLLAALRRPSRPPGVEGLAGFATWITWPARWSWRRAATLIRRAAFYHRPLSVALRRFSDEWWPLAQPLLLLQGQRLFHLASAALAVGLLAGFYVRGIALEYRAGWESTFLGPAQVQALLHWIYGLAAAVSGIELPATPEATAALHWNKGMGGGPAAPWIHLMAVTALLLVVLPRLAMAAWMTWQLRQRDAAVMVPETLLPYARVALRNSDAAPAAQSARLTAYAYEPASASEQGVHKLLRAVFGPETRLDFAPRVAYGDETSPGAQWPGTAPDLDVLLFSLAATPEAENHGAMLIGARDRLARQGPDARLLVLVDEAPYLARMRGDTSLAARIAERRAAWHDFVQAHGLRSCCVDLATLAGEAAVAQPLLDQLLDAVHGRGA